MMSVLQLFEYDLNNSIHDIRNSLTDLVAAAPAGEAAAAAALAPAECCWPSLVCARAVRERDQAAKQLSARRLARLDVLHAVAAAAACTASLLR